jgi:hypothetical protein
MSSGGADLVVHLVGWLTAQATGGERPLADVAVPLKDAAANAMPALRQWR